MTYYAVDPFNTESLQEQLLDLMRKTGEVGHWLALVDMAFDHGSKALAWKEKIWPVYNSGKLLALESVSPVLLRLNAENPELLKNEVSRLLRHCRGRPMLSFIHTENAPETLIEAWQSVLEIETADEQSLVLRFADTRTLPIIQRVLQSDAWVRLSYQVSNWIYIDRDGRLQSLPPVRQEQEQTSAPIRIENVALAEFLNESLPDALANAMHEHFSDLLVLTGGATTYQRLAKICDLAKSNGIEAFPDMMAMAVAVYSTDEKLLEDGRLVAWLGQRTWATGQFSDALSDYMEKITE